MKFYITQTSDSDYAEVEEINTIEELLTFCKNHGNCLCLYPNWSTSENDVVDMISWGVSEEKAKEISSCKYQIEIYDDWRE